MSLVEDPNPPIKTPAAAGPMTVALSDSRQKTSWIVPGLLTRGDDYNKHMLLKITKLVVICYEL